MRLLLTFSGSPEIGSRTIAAVAASGMTLIYRVRRIAAFEDGGQVGRRGVAHHDARGARGAADVRREDHVREAGELRMEARLALEDVQARAGDALLLQRLDQGGVVDDAAARAVHEDRGGLHPRDL